jgi:hypothetical protein
MRRKMKYHRYWRGECCTGRYVLLLLTSKYKSHFFMKELASGEKTHRVKRQAGFGFFRIQHLHMEYISFIARAKTNTTIKH